MTNLLEKLGSTDRLLFYTINRKTRCRVMNALMPAITSLGSAEFTVTLTVVLLLMGRTFPGALGLLCAVSLSASHLAVHIIKRLVNRPRPFETLEDVNVYDFNLELYSFPSGHTTAAFSVGMIFALLMPHYYWIFFTASSLVGISRIYLGVHYPTDVLVGAAIGLLSAYVTLSLLPL